MGKIVFLVGSIPNPRIAKKINSLKKENDVYLIYWSRNDKRFNMPLEVNIAPNNINKISLNNPYKKKFKRVLLTINFYFKAKKLLAKIKPNVIHACALDMAFLSYIYSAKNRAIHIVYELGDLREIMFKNYVIFLQRRILKRIDLLILTSTKFWSNYFIKYKICTADKKYLFIPNVPEEKIFKEYKKKEKSISLTIGYCGMMRFREQLLMLIKVVSELIREDYKIDIFLAGNGVEADLIKEYAQKYDFITYIKKYNYQKEIAKLIAKLDIIYCLYPSNKIKKDVIANRFYEAIICGIPILSPKNTWQGELTLKYNIGFTVSHKNPNELKDILRKIYKDRKLIENIQKRCKILKPNFAYKKYESLLLRKYCEILENK